MNIAPTFSALLLVTGTVFGSAGWDQYESIMARAPFGKEPVVEEVKKVPEKTGGQLEKLYRLSAIYEGVDGVPRVGVVNRASNKSTCLVSGEMDAGLTLLDVRFETGEALLVSAGERVWLKLQGVAFSGVPANQMRAGKSGSEKEKSSERRTTARKRISRSSNTGSRARLVRKAKTSTATSSSGGSGGSDGVNDSSTSVVSSSTDSDATSNSSTTSYSGNYNVRSLTTYETKKFNERL